MKEKELSELQALKDNIQKINNILCHVLNIVGQQDEKIKKLEKRIEALASENIVYGLGDK